MKSIFQYIITEATRYNIRRKKIKPSPSLVRKEQKYAKIEIQQFIKGFFFILLGVISASFGLKGFLMPIDFIDGGVTGISLIISTVSGLPLSLLLIIINLPFLILGFSSVSKQFAYRSILAIVMLALAVQVIPYPAVTSDKLLVALFGGFFLGLGIGLAIRGGSVLDGTEVLAVFLSRKLPISIGDIILIFNIIIFSVAAIILSVETALYAILTYFAASKTVDFIVDGIEEYIGVTIISDFSEDIRMAVIENLGRGCTLYTGKKGYAARGEKLKETDIVYTLITRLELSKLQTEVDKIDKNAFLVMHSIKDARGGMIKKRPLKKIK
ncbi:MAG TPA: YitT family protein [Bacteroidales bacterium]|nr:YitT family protein [Bacteroidales bacterium]